MEASQILSQYPNESRYEWPMYQIFDGGDRFRTGLMCYYNGTSEQDRRQAFSHFLGAAAASDDRAAYCLGVCYMRGCGVKQNTLAAIQTWQRVVHNSFAYFALGVCYQNGWGVAREMHTAFEYYRRAAVAQNQHAIQALYQLNADNANIQRDVSARAAYIQPQNVQPPYTRVAQSAAMIANQNKSRQLLLYDIQQRARYGDRNAQYQMGSMYYEGRIVPPNIGQAIFWYEQAAAQNLPEAMNNLAICYETSGPDTYNFQRAFEMYLRAAKLNYAKAQYNVARCYYYGIGIEKNCQQAVQWLKQAALRDNKKAIQALGRMDLYLYADPQHSALFETGAWIDKVPLEPEFSIVNYQKAAHYNAEQPAGNQNNPIYSPIKQYSQANSQKVRRFLQYKQAADSGDINSCYHLADCYFNGIGTYQNKEAAFAYYQQAASVGHLLATRYLAFCYQTANGVGLDEVKAFQLYSMVAYTGDPVAQRCVGDCYCRGRGVATDLKAAVHWYELAAEQNDPAALSKLEALRAKSAYNALVTNAPNPRSKSAKAYYQGVPAPAGVYPEKQETPRVRAFEEEKLEMLQQMATDGDANAQFELANCYLNGYGAPRDQIAACQLYQKAAAQRHVDSMLNLALCYAEGKGIEKNLELAYKIYNEATDFVFYGSYSEI